MKQKVFLSGMILLLTTCAAWSDLTVYSDRASFEAAIGPSITYTFETDDGFPAAPAPITSFGSVQVAEYQQNGDPAYIRNYPSGTTNQILSGAFDAYTTGKLVVTFTSPEYSMGFDVYPYGVPTWITVSYGGLSPTTITYTVDADLSVDIDSSIFFGLTSTDEIISFEVNSMGDSRSQVYKGIDNFTIVPEPVALGMLMPLVALLVQRDRR